MSNEKEVRRLVRKYGEWHNAQVVGKKCLCAACENAFRALSEPPDVVVLAQRLFSEHGLIDEEGALHITIEWDMLQFLIEQQFHVCLTDDGWEWVEEGE